MDVYDQFADVYATLFDDTLYEKWLAYTLEETQLSNDQVNWLDLACGDGRLAFLAAQEGIAVKGIDLSERMIGRAKNTSTFGSIYPDFSVGDMRHFDLANDKVNVITLFCDSLLYLTDEDEIKATFSSVYQALQTNGYFLFDIVSPTFINEKYPGYMYVHEWDDVVFAWSSEQFRGLNTIDHTLNMFIASEDEDKYIRYEEIHEQQVLNIDKYQELLKVCGFSDIKVTSDFSNASFKSTDKRIFFSCIKR